MQKTKFAIDFLADKTFEGYTKGEAWNGFACPYFTFDQAQQLVQAWREVGSDATYNNIRDKFTFQMSDSEQDRFGSVELEGIKLYPIGNGCWIWEEVLTTTS